MWVRDQNAGGSVWRTSSLAMSLCIALVFLVVWEAILQGTYSHTEKHMRGQRISFSFSHFLRHALFVSDQFFFLGPSR